MAKNIIVVNQKGGVGKSLVADEIAFSFERSGIPLSFYDMDSQGGTTHKSIDTPGAEVAVIDTPGALQSELKTWLEASDLVVVPTRTTSREFDILRRMIKIIDSYPEIPAVFVLNAVNRFKICAEFREWFKTQAEGRTVYMLPQSEAFVQATAYGKSVVEYAPRSKAAKQTVEMANGIRRMLGFEEE